MTDPICPVQEDDLHAYADDRLDPVRRGEVEARMSGGIFTRQT